MLKMALINKNVERIVSKNPAKGYQIIGKVKISSQKEIEHKTDLSNKAKVYWKELGVKKRVELIKPLLYEFTSKKEEMICLISREIGKPLWESKAEVEVFLNQFNWFLENIENSIKEEITYEDNNSIHKIVYEPKGSVAVITPWNFPFGMAVLGIIPNLLVGNTVIFKISEECPLVGKLIEKVIENQKLPKGVFSEIYGNEEIGKKLVHGKIDFIHFIGSSEVGQKLYQLASKKFISVVLELGGSNSCILFNDIDVKKIVPLLYSGRYRNCGQNCDSIKRLIVHKSIFNEVVEGLYKLIKIKKIGDPFNKEIDLGSLASRKQLKLIESQVKDALKKGAKELIGGQEIGKLNGAFYKPRILINIQRNMKIWKKEVFGPVLPLMKFDSEEEAIDLANDSPYGLGAKIFSNNVAKAKKIASKLDVGNVEINGGNRWIPCNPYGGYKRSGIGKQYGQLGFKELCQIKIISIKK